MILKGEIGEIDIKGVNNASRLGLPHEIVVQIGRLTKFQISVPAHQSWRLRWRRCAVDAWTVTGHVNPLSIC